MHIFCYMIKALLVSHSSRQNQIQIWMLEFRAWQHWAACPTLPGSRTVGLDKEREHHFSPQVYILGWVVLGALPSLALGINVVWVFIPSSLYAKVMVPGGFQVTSSNVTRGPQSLVRHVAPPIKMFSMNFTIIWLWPVGILKHIQYYIYILMDFF